MTEFGEMFAEQLVHSQCTVRDNQHCNLRQGLGSIFLNLSFLDLADKKT